MGTSFPPQPLLFAMKGYALQSKVSIIRPMCSRAGGFLMASSRILQKHKSGVPINLFQSFLSVCQHLLSLNKSHRKQRPFLEELQHRQQQGALRPARSATRGVAEGRGLHPLSHWRRIFRESYLTSHHEPFPCVTTGPDHSSSVPLSRASHHRNTEVHGVYGFTWILHCGQVRLGAVSNHWKRLRKEKKNYSKSFLPT